MKLDELLRRDPDANRFFTDLPAEVKDGLRQCGQEIENLAALREYARDVSIDRLRYDGSPLDPALRAAWTRSHET